MSLYIFSSVLALLSMGLTGLTCSLLFLLFSYPTFEVKFLSAVFIFCFFLNFLILIKPWLDFIKSIKNLWFFNVVFNSVMDSSLTSKIKVFATNLLKNKPIIFSLLVIVVLNFFTGIPEDKVSKNFK